MLLGDLGAEVIKIESDTGDLARQVGPHAVGPHNVYFASLNRNKKSVQLDLFTAAGRERLGELARTSDALLVNMKASTVKKLGLTYESLRRYNEKLVCVALTGYGLEGPADDDPAFDYLIQASTGIAAMTGEPDGPPALAGYSAVDNSSGIMAALGLLAKVVEGTGGQVDVALYDVMLSQLNYKAAAYLNAGAEPQRYPLGGHPHYVPAQLFRTLDGHLALFVSHDRFWKLLAEELGRGHWATDPRFATMEARAKNREALLDELSAVFASRPTQEWIERLKRLRIPVSAVRSLADALDDPVTLGRGMVVELETECGPIRTVGSPIRIEGFKPRYARPPLLGEHSSQILTCAPAARSGRRRSAEDRP
jgi:crotonobetainyl-CoA:carnitine CoA-transferase CaiB-like acyl-CoA transferase